MPFSLSASSISSLDSAAATSLSKDPALEDPVLEGSVLEGPVAELSFSLSKGVNAEDARSSFKNLGPVLVLVLYVFNADTSQ